MIKQIVGKAHSIALAFFVLAPVNAFATTIDFETGAPVLFIRTSPLTTYYSDLGVTFSGIGGNAGSIVDQSGNFGIDARSGSDFLAFSDLATGIGDRISFASPASNFNLYVGSRYSAPFTATAYDQSNTVIATTTIRPAGGVYGDLSLSVSGISYVDVTSPTFDWVADDLSFNVSAVPEPSIWEMMILGFAGVGVLAYRRKCSPSRRKLAPRLMWVPPCRKKLERPGDYENLRAAYPMLTRAPSAFTGEFGSY